jgi:hypothetical protein
MRAERPREGSGHLRGAFLNPRLQRRSREADGRTRTGDILFTREVLYQLSYVGGCAPIVARTPGKGGIRGVSILTKPRSRSLPGVAVGSAPLYESGALAN